MSKREMPHSIEAEEGLLSCCMMDGTTVIARCELAKLTPQAFYDSKHGRVFTAILALHSRNEPTDVSCVAVEMRTSGELDAVGGYAFLAQITQAITTTAQASFFITKVRELWVVRELIRFAKELAEECEEPIGNLAEFLSPKVAWMETALSRVMHANGGVTLEQRIIEVKEDARCRAEGKEDRSGWIYSDFRRFDEHLRPLGSDAEDHVVLIGGGSGHGKSALMRQWAGAALRRRQVVVNYTRETSVKGWVRQLASNWARVDLRHMDSAPKDVMERYYAATDELLAMANKRLFVYQHEPSTPLEYIEQLGTHARTWVSQHGAPHLIVVDYLQLFDLKKSSGKQREAVVAAVSHQLQALQREIGCVLLVGAQYNEAGLKEMKAGRRDDQGRLIHRIPGAGDFRESQAMYHDADRVLAIYRPPEDCRGNDQNSLDGAMPEQWICQIKRRYGGEGAVRCWFEKRFVCFRELGNHEHSVNSAVTAAVVRATGSPTGETRENFQKRAQ